jgi:hypothetical protein
MESKIDANLENTKGSFAGLSAKRMMGLEPTTFCMANAGRRAGRFGRVRLNAEPAGISCRRANASERERTATVAIVATEPAVGARIIGGQPRPESVRHAGSPFESSRQIRVATNPATLKRPITHRPGARRQVMRAAQYYARIGN